MRSKLSLFIFFISVFTPLICIADYAWIPRYKNLNLKLGFDFLSSKENFGSDGQRGDILFQNRAVELTQYLFWTEGEYGIAKDWSVYLRPTYVRNSLDPQTGSAVDFPIGSGLGDLTLGIKWNVIPKPYLFTLEVLSKVPLYSTSDPAADELVLGDGDFNAGLVLHGGYRLKNRFLFALSPGIRMRTKGYASLFTFDAMTGVMFHPVYFRLFFNWSAGLGKEEVLGLVTNNAEPGSGGSFGRLSKNTDLLSAGAKLGVRFHEQYRFDVNFSQALSGNLAPNYWQLGINLFATWDFFKPEKKIQVREVPFESDQTSESEL